MKAVTKSKRDRSRKESQKQRDMKTLQPEAGGTGQLLHATHVLTSTGIDFQNFTFGNKKRDLHGSASA